jgi:hypothetical protein
MDVKFLKEQAPILLSQHSNFVDKIKRIAEIKMDEFSHPTVKKGCS